ncbi:MAG: hypothetical protein LAO79_27365 [Acidobacteriia bacterium]|nr:hypothetical protein [Terriglobia bacterium]
MIKVALLCLLVLAGTSIGVALRSPSAAIVSPDIPPPSCAPDCPLQLAR